MNTHNWCTQGSCERGAMKPRRPQCLRCSNYDPRTGQMRHNSANGFIREATLVEHRRFMGVPEPSDG